MASTQFQDYNQNNPIVSAWLNDINQGIYSPLAGVPRLAAAIPVAWVRFFAIAGVVTIQQSVGVASVTRVSAGLYLVTYATAMPVATNHYQITSNVAGFNSFVGETTQSVQVQIQNSASTLLDTFTACVQISAIN
jgi:hypothetical protein